MVLGGEDEGRDATGEEDPSMTSDEDDDVDDNEDEDKVWAWRSAEQSIMYLDHSIGPTTELVECRICGESFAAELGLLSDHVRECAGDNATEQSVLEEW